MNIQNFIMLAAQTADTAAKTAKGSQTVLAPIVELINSLVTPMLLVVTALGALYCILLGVKFAKAEEPQEHEKAKNHLKNAIIGYILIFVLMLVLRLATPLLVDWVNDNSKAITTEDLQLEQ